MNTRTAWIRHPYVLAAIVALVSVAAYLPAVSGPWIYDDHFLIPNNPYVHSLDWWPRWLISDFWDIGEEYVQLGARITYWRPFVTATYAVEWQLGGGSPLTFHISNLIWHAGVGALAFLALRRWIGAELPALAAALIFAVHPTKAESVAWIAGRTDVICMFAALMVTQGIARRLRGARGGLLLETFGTVLAYTSKEQAIILPAFAAIEGWVALGRPAINVPSIRRMLRVAAPQLGIAIAYLIARKLLLPLSGPLSNDSSLPFVDHVQVVFESIGRFIALTFVPHDLSIQQGLMTVRGGQPVHSMPYVALGVVASIALVAAAFAARKRFPAATVGIGFYLLTLAPTMNIKNTQMVTLISERFLFLPSLGLCLLAGALLVRAQRRWALLLAIAIAAAFTAQSLSRSADYADENAFWERELALHPDSAEARRARVRTAVRQRRYHAALADTLELTRRSAVYEDVAVAFNAAHLLSDLTPDRDRAALEKIDAFCRDMIARVPVAALELPNFSFRIPTGTKLYEREMSYYELRLLIARSEIRSRLGDDETAVAMAKQAVQKCPRCFTAVVGLSMAIARAGGHEDALAILAQSSEHVAANILEPVREMIEKSMRERDRARTTEGPAALEAQASSLASLELWGRAYDVLAPYREQIRRAPNFARGFAELAFRAGEPDVARDVLTPHASAEETEELIAQWSRTMGWAH